ncbi:MAG: PqqD family protein [Acutalibacteraceae bacterium]|nr:PqqD family protein [Acutalibacteraceae bacterium]
MRIKDGYSLKNFDGQYTVVADNGELDNIIVLNDTALFLWNLLKEKDVSKTEMLNALLRNFDISTVLALGDIDVFLRTMKENGITED